MMEAKYYECHITIEPVEGHRLKLFEKLCRTYKFKVANLLMQKTLDKSKLDSFCTGKHNNYRSMFDMMHQLLDSLNHYRFNVYRYKIEAILLDERIK